MDGIILDVVTETGHLHASSLSRSDDAGSLLSSPPSGISDDVQMEAIPGEKEGQTCVLLSSKENNTEDLVFGFLGSQIIVPDRRSVDGAKKIRRVQPCTIRQVSPAAFLIARSLAVIGDELECAYRSKRKGINTTDRQPFAQKEIESNAIRFNEQYCVSSKDGCKAMFEDLDLSFPFTGFVTISKILGFSSRNSEKTFRSTIFMAKQLFRFKVNAD